MKDREVKAASARSIGEGQGGGEVLVWQLEMQKFEKVKCDGGATLSRWG